LKFSYIEREIFDSIFIRMVIYYIGHPYGTKKNNYSYINVRLPPGAKIWATPKGIISGKILPKNSPSAIRWEE
jgi:hypothetical protein